MMSSSDDDDIEQGRSVDGVSAAQKNRRIQVNSEEEIGAKTKSRFKVLNLLVINGCKRD